MNITHMIKLQFEWLQLAQVIKAELQEAVKLHEANRKKEKDLYKKMVQGLQNSDSNSEGKHHLSQPTRWVS